MQIYTNADMQGTSVPPRNWVLGNKTLGVVITNYSNTGFSLSSDKQASIGTLPPFFTVTLPVLPGENLYFTAGVVNTSAIAQPNMFVNLSESAVNVTPNQTPLSLVPGYVQNISGTVSMSGIGQVVIQGTPNVNVTNNALAVTNLPGAALNVGGTINVGNTALNVSNTPGGTLNVAGQVTIGNTPSVNIANTVNANITSGTVNANIQNASISSNILNSVLASTNVVIANPVSQYVSIAAGATVTINIPVPLNVYTGHILRLVSPGNHISAYTPYAGSMLLSALGEYSVVSGLSPVIIAPGYSTAGYLVSTMNYFYNMLNSELSEYLFDTLQISLKNTSGSTISETVTIQLYLKSAMTSIKSTATTPVHTQIESMPPVAISSIPAVDYPASTMIRSNTTGALTNFTMATSSGSTKLVKVLLTIYNTTAAANISTLYVNGVAVAFYSTPAGGIGNYEMDFSLYGITNGGVTLSTSANVTMIGVVITIPV